MSSGRMMSSATSSSLVFKSQQKESTPVMASRTSFVIHSPLSLPLYPSLLFSRSLSLSSLGAEKASLEKVSCCRILEPLLCMSHITLIQSDDWLTPHPPPRCPQDESPPPLRGLLPTACSLQFAIGEQKQGVSIQRLGVRVRAVG